MVSCFQVVMMLVFALQSTLDSISSKLLRDIRITNKMQVLELDLQLVVLVLLPMLALVLLPLTLVIHLVPTSTREGSLQTSL